MTFDSTRRRALARERAERRAAARFVAYLLAGPELEDVTPERKADALLILQALGLDPHTPAFARKRRTAHTEGTGEPTEGTSPHDHRGDADSGRATRHPGARSAILQRAPS